MAKWFFLFSLILSISAQALEPGQSYIQILDRLANQGYQRIGALDLREVRSEGRKIEWLDMDRQTAPDFAEGRRSAYFIRQKQKVYMAPQILTDFSASVVAVLELHEVLGVMGWDKDYEISTSLELLSRMKEGREKNFVLDELEKDYFSEAQLRFNSGSGSSVGGGGDIIPMLAKLEVLDELMKSGKRLTPQFWAGFPGIGFEPLYDKNANYVALQYKVDPQSKKGIRIHAREKIRIYVPVREWRKGKKRQQALKAKIIEYVTSLYPAYADSPKSKVSALSCNSEKKVTFPKAQNAEILTIQQARAALILGCQDMLYISEIRIPSFKNHEDEQKEKDRQTEQPKKSGKRNHDCELRIGNVPFTFTADLRLGEASASAFVTANASRKGQTRADTLIQVFVIGDENGKISTYFVKEGLVTPSKTLVQYSKSFEPGEKTKFTMKTYAGEKMQLQCFDAKRGRP